MRAFEGFVLVTRGVNLLVCDNVATIGHGLAQTLCLTVSTHDRTFDRNDR